jgi:hypothetical protein
VRALCLVGIASLVAGCGHQARSSSSWADLPDIVLVRQVNSVDGQPLQIGDLPPQFGASAIYLQTQAAAFALGPLLVDKADVDLGGGRLVPARIIRNDRYDFEAVVPWGYPQVPRDPKLKLVCEAGTAIIRKEWPLGPLPVPRRFLGVSAPDPEIRAFHAVSHGIPAIGVKLRKPPPVGWRLAGQLIKTSYVNNAFARIPTSGLCPLPFASDQRAAEVQWQLEQVERHSGTLNLTNCRIELAPGQIYFTVGKEARADVLGKGAVVVPPQQVQITSRHRGPVHWFTATIKGFWMPLPGKRAPNDYGNVSFSRVDGDLSHVGLSSIRVIPSTAEDRPAPSKSVEVAPGPLPALTVGYRCELVTLEKRHVSDVPIEG